MTNPPPPPAGGYQAVQPMNPSDEKMWSTLIHLGGIIFGIFPSLIGYLVLKDRGPFVRAHTRSALNFHISLIIYLVGATIILSIVGVLTFGVGFIFLWVAITGIEIAAIIFMIIAAIKANDGQYYTYPLSIEFVK
ncbi:DUF4870 domain-containing protein [Salinibacterium hongtaonis]|nr:DUF4870 domain-containing protein [Salinibacterium hongtaonis]